MKKLVYVLSKNGTVKNYVSEVLIQADENDEETVNVSMNFTTDIEKAIDLVDATSEVYSQLARQLGERLVGIEEEEE
ncbi:TPA: hypothetical protein ACR8OU_002061 [Enterococcus faecium]|uniref:Uncharacterized protein n=1 Tax=Enterococcus durans TaxID=53345 RepID=A0A377KNN0_9ENTE|nr:MULTISPECIES: hypothetical protein [Enterococcus]HAR1310498.1 hypothetical protein [Enterococcus faecium]EOG27030.1 hypothetical protein SMO_01638 [Enterococcus faecium EnGen0182]EOM08195.1 hypothetical protein U9U_01208 [Enterococcus faecium EnGen0260]EOM09202.1 hypothetical protein U9W_02644 [Enterococcus faecium EnGen0261]STP30613.1 Uncharacterised protein [Enterococcus durans]